LIIYVYHHFSKPAGPLPQGTLSYGGSFFFMGGSRKDANYVPFWS
jgi:hypothetical protein